VVIYRRHKKTCKFKADRISMKCRCALWGKGTVEGRPFERSLKTRSFERAGQIIQDIENGGITKEKIGILEAFDKFIAECEARNLAPGTLRRYRALRGRLQVFAKNRKVKGCADFSTDLVRDFRGSWTLAPRTAQKELERLKSFFAFCAENDWVKKIRRKASKARKSGTAPRSHSALESLAKSLRSQMRERGYSSASSSTRA
jgi:hypothetical protein